MDKHKKDWNRVYNSSPLKKTHYKQVNNIINVVNFNYFLDCGPGTVGSEAWSVRDLLPECKIVGFEPQHERFDMLKSNNYPGDLHKLAVADENSYIEGFMGMLDGKSDCWLEGEEVLVDKGLYKKESIQCVTIDSILKDEIDKEIFIWADIEGSELKMLKGAIDSINRGIISGFLLELRDTMEEHFISCTKTEVFSFLYDNGFKSLSGENIEGSHKDFLFTRL